MKTVKKIAYMKLDPSFIKKKTGQYISIKPNLAKSKKFACGKERLNRFIGVKNASEKIIGTVAHHCYEMKPTATCTLSIRFIGKEKLVKPKGVLSIITERGKLSKQVVKLDGKTDVVKVEYTAPDETIKNSIRARMTGFTRGKIHLHFI